MLFQIVFHELVSYDHIPYNFFRYFRVFVCDLIHEFWVFVQSRCNRRACSSHFSSSRVVVKPPQSGSPGIVETENLNGH